MIETIQATFGPQSESVLLFITNWGGPLGWFLLYPILFHLFGSRIGMRVALITLAAGITNTWAKWLIVQPRPYYLGTGVEALKISPGLGMPSGHAQGVAAHWTAMAWVFRKNWLWVLAIAVILATGVSRLYFGVHSPEQVLVGWILGFILAFIMLRFEAPLLAWFAPKPLTHQFLLITTLAVIMVAITLGILELRASFVVPEVWLSEYETAQIRLGEEQPFSLFDSRFVVFCSFTYGTLLCGLAFLRRGAITHAGWGRRCLSLVIGIAGTLIWYFIYDQLTSIPLLFAVAGTLPFLNVYLPMAIVDGWKKNS